MALLNAEVHSVVTPDFAQKRFMLNSLSGNVGFFICERMPGIISSQGPSACAYNDDNPSTNDSDLPLTNDGANDAAAPVSKRFLIKSRRDDIVRFSTCG